jgi:uncharacterized protein YciI
MSHFVYKLIPPRPTFAGDMSDAEAELMGQHFAYWSDQLERGHVVVFGPVADPGGVWGLGVIEADDVVAARALVLDDPAITSGLGTFELHPIDAIVRT